MGHAHDRPHHLLPGDGFLSPREDAENRSHHAEPGEDVRRAGGVVIHAVRRAPAGVRTERHAENESADAHGEGCVDDSRVRAGKQPHLLEPRLYFQNAKIIFRIFVT